MFGSSSASRRSCASRSRNRSSTLSRRVRHRALAIDQALALLRVVRRADLLTSLVALRAHALDLGEQLTTSAIELDDLVEGRLDAATREDIAQLRRLLTDRPARIESIARGR